MPNETTLSDLLLPHLEFKHIVHRVFGVPKHNPVLKRSFAVNGNILPTGDLQC